MNMLTRKPESGARRRASKGFTLMEVLIASGLLLMLMGLTMNAVHGFNRSGNQLLEQAGLEEQLRSTLNRVEKEMLEASRVLPTATINGTLYTSGPNTLVLSVPIYSPEGFIIVDDAGTPAADTLLFRSQNDPASTRVQLNRPAPVSTDRLLFSLVPNAKSRRVQITDQPIAKHLMPKNGTNYSLPSLATGSFANVVAPTFSYYDQFGAVVADPSTDAEALRVAQVKVLLWGEKNQGARLILGRKEVDIRFRNWQKP